VVRGMLCGSKRRKALKKEILERDKYKCAYCGLEVYDFPFKVSLMTHPQTATVDHRIPLSKGGTWDIDNLVTACLRCNSRKGAAIWK